MRHDVTFPLYVEVDEIYNLACPASPVHYQLDPVQTTKTSVLGAVNMLGLARRVKAPKSCRPRAARSTAIRRSIRSRKVIGAASIRWGRGLATTKASAAPRRSFLTTGGSIAVRIKVARIFNTYGPNMHPQDGRVVSNFIVQALKGEDITIYGDGAQTRSFCYVDDLIEAMVRLMADGGRIHRTGQCRKSRRAHDPRARVRGSAADRIAETGSPSNRWPMDDPQQRKPDIALARQKLRWEPRTPLAQGLEAHDRVFPRARYWRCKSRN